jgi:hypothetical protein
MVRANVNHAVTIVLDQQQLMIGSNENLIFKGQGNH